MTTQDPLFGIEYSKVMVTGGGSGIGRAVTLELAKRGVDVWIMGRREEMLAETAEMAKGSPGTVNYVATDVRDVAAVENAFAKAGADGPVQGLVHGAGEVWPCAAERLTSQIYADVVQTQLVGAFNVLSTWSRALIKASKPGALVAYSSNVGGRETPGLSHSSSTKAGLEGLVRTWAVELGRFGLRLNVVAPGLFPFETALQNRDSFFDVDMFKKNVPLGRFGVPDEIVAPTLFLLGKGSAYCSGTILHVDGGMRLRPWFGFTPENLASYGADVA